MTKFILTDTLAETPAFGGFTTKAKGASLTEECGMAIISVTIRTGSAPRFNIAFQKLFGAACPSPRESLMAGETKIVPSAVDQVFVIEKTDPSMLEKKLIKALGKHATTTDQTDGWGILTLAGPKAITTMERVSQVDMDISAFPVGAVARTELEHVGAIVVREQPSHGEDHRFMLISPRSSAASFLHSITSTTPFAY